jgi:hypothetical protein
MSTGIVVWDRFSQKAVTAGDDMYAWLGHRESQPDTSVATADCHFRGEAASGGRGAVVDR